MPDAKTTLKEWCDANKLTEAILSDDGGMLSLGNVSISGTDSIAVSSTDGREIQYSVASIFLQILDPDQGLVKYRGACKKHHVKDAVKALDKPVVVGYFLANSVAAASADEAVVEDAEKKQPVADAPAPTATAKAPEEPSQEEAKKTPSASTTTSTSTSRKDHDKHRRDKDKKRTPPSSKDKHADKRKKYRSMVTNEQLFSNLNVVVDKRAGGIIAAPGEDLEAAKTRQMQENEEFEAIRKALSPEGFQVTPEMIEKHKEITETLMAHEIPVGDSASILRASSVGANLTRVLQIFLETVNPKLAQKKGGASPSSPIKKITRPYLLGKKPIILLPKGMTSPITMPNGYEFFANARFIPRDVMSKNKALQINSKTTCFTRKMPGVGLVEFELLDNPRKLQSKEEWERVVSVIVIGQKWQFKDWPGKYSDPVLLFGKTFGFYIGMEGDKLPQDLLGWACKQGKLHRDKRGLDSVTYASFWNNLDDWIKIHRPELLPQPE
jgi:parafibromin